MYFGMYSLSIVMFTVGGFICCMIISDVNIIRMLLSW